MRKTTTTPISWVDTNYRHGTKLIPVPTGRYYKIIPKYRFVQTKMVNYLKLSSLQHIRRICGYLESEQTHKGWQTSTG